MAELSNNACRFDDEIAWLQEAARYFANRPTGGEDAAHWSNVCNAENANKIASHLDALSSRHAPEAVAWRWRWPDTNKWHYADYNLHPEAEEVQALAVIPTEALDSSLRDTHRAAVTDVLADCPGCGVAPLRLHKADCEIMLSRTPASDTTGGYEAAGQRSEPKSTHPVQGGEA